MRRLGQLLGLFRRGAPLHPIFVHFTIALTCASLVFDALAFFLSETSLNAAGAWTLMGAAVMTLITISTGLTSRMRAPVEEGEARSFLQAHTILGFIFYGLLIGVTFWRLSFWQAQASVSWLYLGALTVVSMIMTVQGYLGGELVYRFGVEVEPVYRELPEKDPRSEPPQRPASSQRAPPSHHEKGESAA